MSKWRTIATFDGGYHRNGEIYIGNGECSVCGAVGIPVISIDGSEGEYATGGICEQCCKKAFATPEEEGGET